MGRIAISAQGLSALLTCLVIAVAAAIVAGAASALPSDRAGAGPDEPSAAGDGRPSQRVDASGGPTRLPPVVPATTVAPLRRVVPPDVLVVGAGTIDGATLRKISEIRGVRETASVDGGSVRLRGRPVDVFGVQPSAFRGWTPPPTATADGLWAALARGELVTSFETGRKWRLDLGATYRVDGRANRRLRLGAIASLGLPGVDALVSERTGRRLGLDKDLGVLVNAPGADIGKLVESLGALLGEKAQIVALRDDGAGSLPTAAAPRGRPTTYIELYRQAAARCPGLSWTVLAAIGQIESGHGRNNGPSSAGALGPMQFMPATWRTYGIDGSGDGRADIMNPYDAVPSAAEYLCANGAGHGGEALADAIWRYNHAGWYVRDVLALARAYARVYG